MFGMNKIWDSIRYLSADIESIWGALSQRLTSHADLVERHDKLFAWAVRAGERLDKLEEANAYSAFTGYALSATHDLAAGDVTAFDSASPNKKKPAPKKKPKSRK